MYYWFTGGSVVEFSPAMREAWVHFPAHAPTVSPWGFPGSSVGERSACNAGDLGSISGSGRSPGEGIGYPLQYSSWGILMDRDGALQSVGLQRVRHN